MCLGKLVEVADNLELGTAPLHRYTKALFAASLPSHPDEQREEIVLSGEVPSALKPPRGLPLPSAAPFCDARCSDEEPVLAEVFRWSHGSLPPQLKSEITIEHWSLSFPPCLLSE